MSTTSKDHPNVEVVRRSFDCASAGDATAALAYWKPGARYHAFDANGIPSDDVRTLDEVMQAGRHLISERTNDIVAVRAIGSELVALQLRVHARSRDDQVLEAEYLLVLSVRDGLIQWACDFIDTTIEQFLDQAWA